MKWLLCGLLFLAPLSAISAQELNAGFVEGLWYDDETIFAGEETRIYVAIRNNTGVDLSGRVEFYIDGERLARNAVSALDGRIIESWADWVPEYGEHEITARLTDVRLHKLGEDPERIDIETALAEDTVFVDHDTDNDGIGNRKDTDDDGDGLSDQVEGERGTNPLDPDDPGKQSNEDGKANEDTADTNGESDTSNNDDAGSSDGPEGLEQFLTESRADRALVSITNVVNRMKRSLDAYREERNEENDSDTSEDVAEGEGSSPSATSSTSSDSDDNESETATTATGTSKDGFGEVTRSKTASASSVFTNIWELAKTLISNLYTLILFILSLYLAHPIVVQLTLLLLILFLVFKLAKRYGSRPS